MADPWRIRALGRSEAQTKSTHVRHGVVAMTFLMGTILYLDRASLSILVPAIERDLKLGPMAIGWIFSAFVWGYTLMHIPAGWLADRFGARRLLTAIVMAWSIFCGLTGAAWDFVSLLLIRFLFGAAESGATPNVSRTFAWWIPLSERASAQSLYFAGMSAGSALAAPLATFLFLEFGWRMTCLCLSTVGLVWATFWYVWFRDDPHDHASVGVAELAILPTAEVFAVEPCNWRKMLRDGNLWAILLMYFCFGYTGYISITWFPSYLVTARHFTIGEAGILAAMPNLLSLITKPTGGWWSDRLTRRRGVVAGRRTVGAFGFGFAALAVISGFYASEPHIAVGLLSMADAGTALAHGVCFALCLDIGLAHAGVVSALMLTAGSLGNAASALAFGASLQSSGSWTAPFMVAAGADLVAAVLWLRIDPRKKLT